MSTTKAKGKARSNAGVAQKSPSVAYPSFSAYPNLSLGGWQSLNKRPDSFSRTDREREFVNIAGKLFQKVQAQMDQLLVKVSDWVKSNTSRIAGFGGSWQIQEFNIANDMPTVRAMFLIVQSDQDNIDEPLWLDIAHFDVEISKLPEFSNVRVNFTPLPFMEQEKVIAYLQLKFGR